LKGRILCTINFFSYANNVSDWEPNPNPNPNPNHTTKQNATVTIQLNAVTRPTYPGKFIRAVSLQRLY